MRLTDVLDTILDRSLLGYTRIGPSLRRRWWPSDPPPDALTGRRILVTGATSGLGQATAAGLARLGAIVHVHGHSRRHLDAALAELRKDVPEGEFHEEQCDLSDLAAVRGFVADFTDRVGALHGLVHNAGTMAPERRESVDGHEFTLAVMVLGPQLLTALLRDTLAAADEPAVVYMSSGGMYAAGLPDDDPEYREGDYSGTTAYARCKRMQVVLAQMWADRLEADGVEVASMHPGWVDTRGVAAYLPKFRAATYPLIRNAAQGADTMIWLLATRPSGRDSTRFWHDRKLRPTHLLPGRDEAPQRRRRLWNHVASATGTSLWDDDGDAARHFDFGFAQSYRLPAMLFGITDSTACVTVDDEEVSIRFGPWRLRTPLDNIETCDEVGGFSYAKTAGPPRMSLADRGVTFATNPQSGVCVRFRQPAAAVDPTGHVLHPAATVTVADPSALMSALDGRQGG